MPKKAAIRKEKIILQLPEKSLAVSAGTPLANIAARFREDYSSPIVGAKYNNVIVDLHEPVGEAGKLEWLDLRTEDGLRIYRQSLVFLLARAAYELFPHYRIVVKHSLGPSYYCELKELDSIPPLDLIALEAKMRELVAADEPIMPQTVSKKEAQETLALLQRQDAVELLENLGWDEVKIYCSGPYAGYSQAVLAPSTGVLGIFRLEQHHRGFILRFPSIQSPGVVAPYYHLPKLGQVWRESKEWAGILGVHNVAGLLNIVKKGPGEVTSLIHVGEALQEKKIAQLADEIFARRDKTRLILIAGPSSSGKTTFAQRLVIQLRVLGLQPISVSTDDYFVDRELTPKDENGEYDFEALEAVDLPLFNEHLQQLLDGCEVDCPVYNFKKGAREYPGKRLQVDSNHPIIVEGIHALNEKLTVSVKRENKYKIYISALTQIIIDDHNRIQTTDARLIRRIVRDSRFRSQDALKTLKRWPSVRRGEERYIFPYQEDADTMFNSALVYELGIFKKYAYPLLAAIGREEKEFSDAQRLLNLLDFFPEIPDHHVPLNSILREFIGGSSIHGN